MKCNLKIVRESSICFLGFLMTLSTAPQTNAQRDPLLYEKLQHYQKRQELLRQIQRPDREMLLIKQPPLEDARKRADREELIALDKTCKGTQSGKSDKDACEQLQKKIQTYKTNYQ